MGQSITLLSLLLLLILVETSQGIRFEEETLAVFRSITHKENFRGKDGASDVKCSENEQCSGRIRKLISGDMPASKPERSDENMEKKSEGPKKFDVESQEGTAPDVADINRMDYSPAKRKPPIHN